MILVRGKQTPWIRVSLILFGIFMLSEAQAAKIAAHARAVPVAKNILQTAVRNPASAHEISEAIDITGQSRNLSMGLMFQRDKDKLSFGSPRTNYKDKITSQQTNY